MASETPEPSDDDLTGRRRSTYTPPSGETAYAAAGAGAAAVPQQAEQAGQMGWGEAEFAQTAHWDQQMSAIGTPEPSAEVQRSRAAYAPSFAAQTARQQQPAPPV